MRLPAFVVGLTLSACAAGNHASGRLLGRKLSFDEASGTYCWHCAGGIRVEATLRPKGAEKHSKRWVGLGFDSCSSGVRQVSVNGEARISFGSIDADGREVTRQAVRGEIDVGSCSKDHLRASFWGEFPDGDRIDGSVSVPLEQEEGYD